MQNILERLYERRDERGDEGGFTLIELLIVIVILGILAAIVVFAVQNLTGQSATAACQAQYKTVETALESYKAQMGTYPTDYTTLQNTTTTGIISGASSAGPWLRDKVPTSTADNPNYWFGYNSTSGAIIVNAKGNTTTSTDASECSAA